MTDSNDDRRKGRPPGRPDRGRTSGDRPFKSRHDGKPRQEGDRPFRDRGDESPWKSGKGPGKPFRARDKDDRPRRPREDGDKPFRPRRDEGDRPFRGRGGAERPRRFDRSAEERPRRKSEERPETQVEAKEPVEERIAKVIARAGVASRRDAEAMIAEGRVTLNGTVLESPAINVTASDRITVDGEPLPVKERTRLWLYHKPRGLVTTARDPEGRPTVFENLPEDLPRVVAVGRLDINTEGLLLLTNDGGLAKVIAHPDTGWLRRYKVRAHGDVTQADLDRLRDGVTVDEMEYGPVEARLDRVQGDNVWLTLGLREGKNREVKRILEHLGLQVNRLIRLSFGPFQLGDLESDLVEEVRTKVLKDQLGATLATEAGADFEGPVREPIAPFGSPKKDRAERGEDRDERPARRRFDDEERPRHGRDREERPFRSRGEGPRGEREEETSRRPSRLEPKKSVWRADAPEEGAHRKAPRRGADPRAARAASAERPRQRVGAVSSSEGRKVVVERLIAEARDEAPMRRDRHADDRTAPGREDRPRRRPDRDEAPRRTREGGFSRPRRDDEERPRRPRPEGDRSFRSRGESGDRPFKPRREDGDRPFRSRSEGGERSFKPKRDVGDRPFRERGGDDRPRRGPPSRGPSKGRPGGGFKGGSKGGGPKGGPRGRRP
ncbi:pseudouridine synthase [Microvirga puerhi]|uniref:Pseudouridine synthase n=1 Tax=Microvirga puerhi TaxID=2876078 RepID=A0ABS7VKN5_9HYPH|nr:pseudouridine synthase [Microvirga puerhi]MBZ6076091.1 pseudouridine synthase [Microvirga puerhi]